MPRKQLLADVLGNRALRATSLQALFALLLAFPDTAHATGPYATTSTGVDARLMLKGYDPVAYFVSAKPVAGDPLLRTEFDGVTYHFVSEENRFTFMKNPFKYVPMFGGHCAGSMAYAIPWPGDPEVWKIVDGALMVFANESARRYFVMNEAANLRLAKAYWKDEVEGSIALVQRTRRLTMRVPHYKSDKELEAEWQSGNRR